MSITVQPSDLQQAASVSGVARALDAPEIIEYWKSAPYLLNFDAGLRAKAPFEREA